MSQQTSESTVIDGVTYEVRYLSPDDAVDLGIDLAKMAGPALGSAVVGIGRDGEEENKAAVEAALGKVIDELVRSADKATYRRVVETLMRVTAADGVPMVANGAPAWKLHFTGKLGRLAKVLGFGIRVNFSDFFAAGGSTLTSAIARFAAVTPKTNS